MSGFDERGKAFEDKFAHDEEMKFRINNRRNRLLGFWAAELMGLKGVDAESYAQDVIKADFERPGDDDVHDKVAKDLQDKDVDLSDHRLRKKMDELLAKAKEQIMSE